MVKTMTTKELAEYLRVREITICKHAASGEIPAKRLGGLWLFEKEAIDKWIRTGGRTERQATSRSKVRSTGQRQKERVPKRQKVKGS